MLPRQLSQGLGKHDILLPLCEREKDSRMFLRAPTEWVVWIWPQKLQNITSKFLDGSLVFQKKIYEYIFRLL